MPDDRIVELDWDESHQLGGLTFTCTEARHFSGRSLGSNTTLWASWVLAGERRRVFFGGDTGYTPAFTGIGERYGPFELTMLPIGAYDARWPDVHLEPGGGRAGAPRGAVAGVLLPIHWATFDLAFHEWSDPVEWLLQEADQPAPWRCPPRAGASSPPASCRPSRGGAPRPDPRGTSSKVTTW